MSRKVCCQACQLNQNEKKGSKKRKGSGNCLFFVSNLGVFVEREAAGIIALKGDNQSPSLADGMSYNHRHYLITAIFFLQKERKLLRHEN